MTTELTTELTNNSAPDPSTQGTGPASAPTEWTTAIPIDRSTRIPDNTRKDEDHDGRRGFCPDDEICLVLAEAAQQQRAVVLALVDGTRLNGTPLPRRATGLASGPMAFEERTVRLREEAGAEPFVVRLTHVLYVRVLGTRPPTN